MQTVATLLTIFVLYNLVLVQNLLSSETPYEIQSYEYSLLANAKTNLKVQWNVPQMISKGNKNQITSKSTNTINTYFIKQAILLVTDYQAQKSIKKSLERFSKEQCDSLLKLYAVTVSQSLATITEDSLVKKGGSVMEYEVLFKNDWLLSVNQFYSPSHEDLSSFFTSFSSYNVVTGEQLDIATMIDEKKTYYIIEAISSTVSDKSGNETTWQNYAEALRDIYTYCKSKTKNQKALSTMFWNEVQLDCYFTPTHLVVWSPLENSTSILESDVLEVPLSLFSKALKPKYQKMFVK